MVVVILHWRNAVAVAVPIVVGGVDVAVCTPAAAVVVVDPIISDPYVVIGVDLIVMDPFVDLDPLVVLADGPSSIIVRRVLVVVLLHAGDAAACVRGQARPTHCAIRRSRLARGRSRGRRQVGAAARAAVDGAGLASLAAARLASLGTA